MARKLAQNDIIIDTHPDVPHRLYKKMEDTSIDQLKKKDNASKASVDRTVMTFAFRAGINSCRLS